MIGKFFLFALLWRLTGNPILAVIVLLLILYVLDRRFVGLTPNVFKPFQQRSRIGRLRQEIALNPHHASAKQEAARLLIALKRHKEALPLLNGILDVMEDSAEVWYDYGYALLKTGSLAEGEQAMRRALALNPAVRYGEAYLRLGEAFAKPDPEKALRYLEQFKEIQSSSCEAYYRLGTLYGEMGRKEDARRAFREAGEIYRALPKYRRKSERRWALLSSLKR